ncbi:MAG: phosphoenolpyruvate--protein phosphotransferase [Gammaproteobacteria bacterium]|nr:phosphoenolpyruvate--protein phosphotransferase [Gammaproteobacteria bacterium]
MDDHRKSHKLSGKTLAPGMGRGKVFIYGDVLTRLDEFYAIEQEQIDEESQRFERAVESVSDDLASLSGRVRREIDKHLSEVFQAHIAIVQDIYLQNEVYKEIREELVSAGLAVSSVFRRWEMRFRSMEANVAVQKGDDISDLSRRLISTLAGVRGHALENIPLGSVLVATRLLPSDTVYLARRNTSAAILEAAGQGSHAALFAHEIGLPCVSGINDVVELLAPGDEVLVDADAAEVIVNPEPLQKTNFKARQQQQEQASQKARRQAREPAVTRNGQTINVLANVGSPEDTLEAMRNGAEGIGLYRIERVYLGRQEPPDCEELMDEMYDTLVPARGLPVYVRLLDIGADKPLPFLESFREINPSLGRRGVRFLLEYPDILLTQLKTLLNLCGDFDLHVIVPMVTLPDDLRQVRKALTNAAARNQITCMPKLGAMIETPAAVMMAAEIAQYADFMSFGTNDLTQYTFAVDRENAAVDAYYKDSQAIIFKQLRTVHEAVPEMPLSICGELASREAYVPNILACGITKLSVAPPSIPTIKQAIRQTAVV